MLSIDTGAKIYLYTVFVDMRKSIDSLVVLLAGVYTQNPQTGDLFVFTNRDHNKVKILLWDRNGFVLYYKRLARGRFRYSKDLNGEQVLVTPSQLKALLMGLDFHLLNQYPAEIYKDFF